MRAIPAIAATVVALVLASFAAAEEPPYGPVVAQEIVATWKCQDQLYPRLSVYERRTRARSPWVPHTYRYWVKEAKLWEGRHRVCVKRLHARAAIVRKLNRGIAVYYRSQHRSSGPLSGQGWAIEAAGRRWGVSPYLMFATSITESSGGLAACYPNFRNIWGLASCGTWNGTPPPQWATWREAFDWYARFLTGRTSVTGGWPNARTAYDYHGYARDSHEWGRVTTGHMEWLFGESSARYPTDWV